MRISLQSRSIVRAMTAIVVLLTIANALVLWVKFRWGHDTLFGLTPLFDLNREGNLPAFYSACALLFASVLVLVVAVDARQRNDRWRRHWLVLGGIFAFLAVDEAAELHGLLSLPLRKLTGASGALFFAWVVPYGVLTLVFAVAYFRFVLALPQPQRGLFVLAGTVYVLGALGFELIAGPIVTARGGLERGLDNWVHAVAYSIEEPLEMIGVLIFIQALLDHLARQRIVVSFDVS